MTESVVFVNVGRSDAVYAFRIGGKCFENPADLPECLRRGQSVQPTRGVTLFGKSFIGNASRDSPVDRLKPKVQNKSELPSLTQGPLPRQNLHYFSQRAMTTRSFSPRATILAGLVLLGALSRLLPHPPNATPVLAIALFGGAYFSNVRWAFGLPLLAMLASDLVLSLTQGHALLTPIKATVYLCIGGMAGLGIWALTRISVLRVVATGLAGALLFFVVTNFAVWAGGTLYPYTVSGLLECYVAALPFFRNTLLSTWGYAALFFGLFEGIKVQFPSLAANPAQA